MEIAAPTLSFVIIARNQAKTIVNCLDSVLEAARARRLATFEIIYVDSSSSDGTVEKVRAWQGAPVRIVHLTGTMNAAIARNEGARVSRGRTLFFIDGDMELDPRFLPAALDAEGRPIHPVIGGQVPEKFYDRAGRYLADGPDRFNAHKRGFRSELGGITLMSREAFDATGGYRPELRINEDMDLGFRLAKAGYPILSLPQPVAIHHTVEYFDWSRLGAMFMNGSMFYAGVTFRRHLTNPAYWPVLITHQRSTAVLLISVLLAIFVHPAALLLYLVYIVLKNLRRPNVTFFQDLVGTTLCAIGFVIGVFAFFPRPVPDAEITRKLEERAP